jgi:ammonium transporter Rh
MVFIGFGFLMTFLRKYGSSAVGMNFFLSALVIQWAILCNGFWNNVQDKKRWWDVPLDMHALVEGDFAAATVMITFGAILGKVSMLQLLVVAFCEIPFYAVNKMVIERLYGVMDIGGSMVIHEFGAYFGLAIAWVLRDESQRDNGAAKHSRHSDLFAMIGTIFLWVMWPSFNGALAANGPIQQRAIVNTLLSLCGATVVVFALSCLTRKHNKLDMEEVQNSTIAGGVCMGTSASMAVYPGGAIGVGMAAGLVSYCGFRWVQPFLEKKCKLHDTCGVHNLHGMPGFLGGIFSIAVAGAAQTWIYEGEYKTNFPKNYGRGKQAGIQCASVFTTLFIAIFTGAIVGLVLLTLKKTISKDELYNDKANWHIEDDDESV